MKFNKKLTDRLPNGWEMFIGGTSTKKYQAMKKDAAPESINSWTDIYNNSNKAILSAFELDKK